MTTTSCGLAAPCCGSAHRPAPARIARLVRLSAGCASLALLAACSGGRGGAALGPSTHYYVTHAAPQSYQPPGPPGDPWGPYIADASRRFDVPGSWIRNVMRVESGGNEYMGGHLTVSAAGAMGLMQLEPETYREMAAQFGLGPGTRSTRTTISWPAPPISMRCIRSTARPASWPRGKFAMSQMTTLPTPVASGTYDFTFVGQDRNLYAFHSIAIDAAGNAEVKSSNTVEASTTVPDLNPPVTHVLATNPAYSWRRFQRPSSAASRHRGTPTANLHSTGQGLTPTNRAACRPARSTRSMFMF